MITLATLLSRLQAEVPAVDGVPTTEQYTQAIKDAAAEFSRRCGVEKFGELAVVSGTAAYNLPDDFLRMIVIESLSNPDGIIITNTGLIPVSANWEERYTIRGGQITFKPTPAYSLTRDYRYKAAWVLNGSDEYEEMGEEEAKIVLLKAAAICFQKQANASVGGMESYSLGAVSVKLSNPAENHVSDAEMKESAFLAACESYNGARLEIS